ncbi:MAG: TRAM domain-containing protein, partial [Thermodesulfobacteriota bacterium]|nr:TRAM domain-containing protein [Thermodesulfobacteriota bacterium]
FQRNITFESNKRDINKTFPILIEGNSRNNPGDLFGRTTQNKVVNVKNLETEFIGEIVDVEIQEAHQNSLVGNLA